MKCGETLILDPCKATTSTITFVSDKDGSQIIDHNVVRYERSFRISFTSDFKGWVMLFTPDNLVDEDKTMLICIKCKAEMRCTKTGIRARWGHSHTYAGDAFECLECGAQVIVANKNPYEDSKPGALRMDDNKRYEVRNCKLIETGVILAPSESAKRNKGEKPKVTRYQPKLF